MVKIKGNSLYLIKRFIVDNYGKSEYEDLVKLCNNNVQEILSSVILSDCNYEWDAYKEIVTAFGKSKSEKEAIELSKFKCEKQLTWMYKALMKVTPWKLFITKAQMIYDIHFTEGKSYGEFKNDQEFVIHIEGLSLNPQVGFHLLYYMEVFYEAASNQNLISSYKIIDNNHLQMTFCIKNDG